MTGYSLWNIPEELTLKIKKTGGKKQATLTIS